MRISLLLGIVASLLSGPGALLAREPAVSFRNEVMPVLSRAGCNSGACHGNLNVKGGFKLSLRGQDPDADFITLTRDALGRRIDSTQPESSLVLAKATAATSHEGGQRFKRGSPEYHLLHSWIARGAKPDPASTPSLTSLEASPRSSVLLEPIDRVSVQVKATFSDGNVRDVTRLALFEPSNLVVRVLPGGEVVRAATGEHYEPGESSVLVSFLGKQAVVRVAFVPSRPGFVWPDPPANNFIDAHVYARLRQLRIQPANLCSDEVFIRRAYLDALGVLPSSTETRSFLTDSRPDKRDRLISQLLERPEFNDFWALKWSDLLRNEEKVLDARGVQLFHGWLRRSFADHKPLDQMARELISARGSSYASPPANYYRALRDPHTRAEATAQVFLGIRLQCARCHNHPFDRWTQSDYHRFAAFFARIDYRIVENNRRDKLDSHEFIGEQIIWQARSGELNHPVTGLPLMPAFLGEATPSFSSSTDRLQVLAGWVGERKNPFFARAQVNRIWQHLMGRGIVDPGDDFRASNPPSNEPLLDALARDFRDHSFDLRHSVKVIMSSRTYQLSSRPNDTNRDDECNFSHAQVRPLQAEQLHDAVYQAVGLRPKFEGFPRGLRAGQLPGVGADRGRRARRGDGEKFLATFGKPVRSLSCECERSDDTTLAQAFQMITGSLINEVVADPDNVLGKLLSGPLTDADILEEIFLATLCRQPAREEREKMNAIVKRARDRRAGFEDVVWGLLNAKEFLLRR